MSDEKAYPIDERGQHDAGAAALHRPPKPCCVRLKSGDAFAFCQLPDGHDGQHDDLSYSQPAKQNTFDKGRRK